MACYSGDSREDQLFQNAWLDTRKGDDLPGIQEFVAVDYFQWGWEAAIKYMENNK